MDRCREEFAVFPFKVHFETTAGTKAFYAAIGPSFWESGKQFQFKYGMVFGFTLALVRLQQHFTDARGSAEIAINLKRRMSVEHVRIRPLRRKQHLQDQIGMLCIVQARPEIEPPAEAPTGSSVPANLQRLAHGSSEFGRAAQRDV